MWAQPAERNDGVPEIRFGVIEPPVVAQKDITIRALTSNEATEPLPLECSGLAWVDGQLLVLSDRHQHVVFTCPVDLSKMTIGQPRPHVIIRNEHNLLDDAESIAIRRRRDRKTDVFIMCSLSNDPRELPLPKRRHMVWFRLDQAEPFRAGEPQVLYAGPVRTALKKIFEAVGVEPYRTFYQDAPGPDKNTYRWGNVEGMTFTPDGKTLLCGMRNPLYGRYALLFTIANADEAVRAGNPVLLRVTDVFALDLGNRGISDLCWDPVTKGYLMTAARSNGPKLDKDQPFPPNTLDSALLWWSGRKSERPILLARAPELKLEAVCRLGRSPYIALGSDEGDISESREQRQSLVIIMALTGIERPLP
ncbi:MAG: hypothetical protein J7M21_05985 [Planctomycetes bacterium]|nr:hypothetical protein [Planctomycetota bacterium]